MPAWITSLLRDEVTVPMPSAASSTITSRPACASRRAIASPITPAPMTTHSTFSILGFGSRLVGYSPTAAAAAWQVSHTLPQDRPIASVVAAVLAQPFGSTRELYRPDH